jgi:nicotinate-nucleotide pyrophosphorylase
MVHTKNGLQSPLRTTPDVVMLDRNTPATLRQIVALLVRHQERFKDDYLRTLHITVHKDHPPQIRFASEMMS